MSDPPVASLGRRKRPRVPEADRKRVAKACESCRRVKEKCEGGIPCSRCRRLDRNCQTQDGAGSSDVSKGGTSAVDRRDDYFDVERIKALERVVNHYAQGISLDKESIDRHLSTLETGRDGLRAARDMVTPSSTTSPNSDRHESEAKIIPSLNRWGFTADLSYCKFFDSVRSKIHERTGNLSNNPDEPVTAAVVYSRTARFRSQDSTIVNAVASLPPIEVARFLVDVFFRFTITNYKYLDETSFRNTMEAIYSNMPVLNSGDAASICVTLMVLALGTQFAHLTSSIDREAAIGSKDDVYADITSPDDSVALALYHAATTLLSDVLIISSLESVQAFLLLGVYTLPVDAAGLSHAYLGIAVRIGAQNNMHRRNIRYLDAEFAEQCSNTWWTVYALERRISVLHGMPVALSRSEIDIGMPCHLLQTRIEGPSDNLCNFDANVKLTYILEDAGSAICSLRQASTEERPAAIKTLSQINQTLLKYWHTLPEDKACRDLTPEGPLFRPNIHLALTYHLVRLFIGRVFIFDVDIEDIPDFDKHKNSPIWDGTRSELVSDCMESALLIIDLCQLLHDEVGLARASYTEFTSCRTAVLVILARRLQENSTLLQTASERGLELLKYMSVGIYSASAEKIAIKAMETAVRRLNRTSPKSKNDVEPASAYDNFRNWAKLWRSDAREPLQSQVLMAHQPHVSATDSNNRYSQVPANHTLLPTSDLDPIMSNFAFGFDEFNMTPGFDPSFRFDPAISNG